MYMYVGIVLSIVYTYKYTVESRSLEYSREQTICSNYRSIWFVRALFFLY